MTDQGAWAAIDNDRITRASAMLQRDRESGGSAWQVWVAAARIDQALKLGWSWDRIQRSIDVSVATPDARDTSIDALYAHWQQRIGQNPAEVAAAYELIGEEPHES